MKMKQNITSQINEAEQLPPILDKLKQEARELKAPDGYFDSLSPRIVDEIKKRENRSILQQFVHTFRKPLIWAPAMATVVVAVLFIFVIPTKKASTIQVSDEWTELKMAYDPSYAEEAILAESITVDKELESSVISTKETVSFAQKEPTVDEITRYLKENEIEPDLLNEY